MTEIKKGAAAATDTADAPVEKKTRGRKPAAKALTEGTAKKTEVKAAGEKKAAEKKPAEKKAAEKKPAAKPAEPKQSVVIQYGSDEVVTKDVVAAAVKAYKSKHRGVEIKTVEDYIKPEEKAAYYVVNGDDSQGDNKIELF